MEEFRKGRHSGRELSFGFFHKMLQKTQETFWSNRYMMQTGFAEQEGFKPQKRDGGNVWERADLRGAVK